MEIKPKRTLITSGSGSFLMRGFLFLTCLLLAGTVSIYAQTKTISGKVTDTADEPLIGVSVRIQGTTTGTITNVDGEYSISAGTGDILEFSYVGMKAQLVTVGSQTTLNIILEDDAQMLTETVVIGYGTARKRDLTGSIVSIKAEDIANRPASNPLANLQGRIAGVQVVNTGRAGQDPEIRIRGTNSINGYKPLYVVDGLFTDNINFLNPVDVESMEILKDPSSLAIFGVRGANGVVIITTKKAKEGQTMVNINSSIGFKHVADRIDLVNAAQFKELYSEQLWYQGADPYDFSGWTGDTDWQKEIFQDGIITNHNISITGSSEKNRFYLGAGYTMEEGTIKHEKLSKVSISLGSEYNVSKALRFGFQVNGAKTLPPDGKGVQAAVWEAPIVPAGQYKDPTTGKSYFYAAPDFQQQVTNPLVDVEQRARHTRAVNHRIVGNVYGELDILKNLTFRATFSLDYGIEESRGLKPIVQVYDPVQKRIYSPTGMDVASVSQSKATRFAAQSDYLLTYQGKFNDDHNLTLTGGITTNYDEYSRLEGTRSQDPNSDFEITDDPDLWWISIFGGEGRNNNGEQYRKYTMSYLVRALYNYQNRYLFNASFRRDGASAFKRTNNTWDNFYSFGGGWIVSEEKFMEDQNIIDYLKIKGSWGVLGSQATGGYDYPAYPLLVSEGAAIFGDNIIEGKVPKYVAPMGLGWEKTYSWEVGFEMNLLKNRLRIEPVYYSKLTKDILVEVPRSGGLRPALSNIGEVENKGFELSASWNDKIGDFTYSLGANLTTINNEVKKLLGNQPLQYGTSARKMSWTKEGFPIGHFFGYKVEGVYQNNEDIKQSPVNTQFPVAPGDLKFVDVNKDGKIDENDRTKIGDPTPDFTYGFNINLGYKNFDLSIDMMGVYGNEIYRDWDNQNFARINYMKHDLNRWHGEGTSNWDPILLLRDVNRQISNYYIEDGSFFRIKNLQLGYTFDSSLLNKIFVKSLRVYANIENLKTWKKNTGYTPELGGTATAFGIDQVGENGAYPMPAVYTFGINLTF
ncbi:TonB-dependent receptor [Prevotella sp. 10(H)]|uniref:SusC/RagA family TonB-linked outer membrane protein n=1 Tax=Prevotella sp. 10(H) TaxID=1158294 RepID=UPI0009DDA931|nr:TonB-dependent receptor [Prevotella sp. 10(H)]